MSLKQRPAISTIGCVEVHLLGQRSVDFAGALRS